MTTTSCRVFERELTTTGSSSTYAVYLITRQSGDCKHIGTSDPHAIALAEHLRQSGGTSTCVSAFVKNIQHGLDE